MLIFTNTDEKGSYVGLVLINEYNCDITVSRYFHLTFPTTNSAAFNFSTDLFNVGADSQLFMLF